MRHECFSQIGSRKINSDIHGTNIRFPCANSWVSVREFGGSVREFGGSVRELGVSVREFGGSVRELGVSVRELVGFGI